MFGSYSTTRSSSAIVVRITVTPCYLHSARKFGAPSRLRSSQSTFPRGGGAAIGRDRCGFAGSLLLPARISIGRGDLGVRLSIGIALYSGGANVHRGPLGPIASLRASTLLH